MDKFLRKGWHLLGLVFPAAYYFGFTSRELTLLVVAAATLLAVVLEAARFAHPSVERAFAVVFRKLLRPEERNAINATVPYLFSMFLTIILFEKTLACLGIAFLAVGDAAAEAVGRTLGRVRIFRGKTLEGTLACFAVCAAGGAFFVDWRLSAAGAAAAAATELFAGAWDNFAVPLVAAAAMWAAGLLVAP